MKFDRCQPNGGTKTSEQSLHLAASRRCSDQRDDGRPRPLRLVAPFPNPRCKRSFSRCGKMRNSHSVKTERDALDLEISFAAGISAGISRRSSRVNRSRIRLDSPTSSHGPRIRSSHWIIERCFSGQSGERFDFPEIRYHRQGRTRGVEKKSGNRDSKSEGDAARSGAQGGFRFCIVQAGTGISRMLF